MTVDTVGVSVGHFSAVELTRRPCTFLEFTMGF